MIGEFGNKMNKKIVIIGTSARGGIKAVIDSYESVGFYSPNRSVLFHSHKEGSISARAFMWLAIFVKLTYLFIMQRVDLVHLHMATKGSFWRKSSFVLLSVIFQKKVILHLHGGAFADVYCSYSAWKKMFVTFIFNSASAIVVLSEFWEKFISGLTKTNIKVVGNFTPDKYIFEESIAVARNLNVLFLGQFVESKGIYDLLDVFSRVNILFPDSRLVCAGDGEIERVRGNIALLNAKDYIETPGWVSGDEKIKLLHRCGIFILPSYHEGLPLAIIEAMSCSMAIISTNVGGIPSLVNEVNGVLVNPGDRDALFEALCKLLSQESTSLAEMGVASRNKYSKYFSVENCLSEMRSLYRSLGVEP